jgi:probable F420-dependent oxidoreductase
MKFGVTMFVNDRSIRPDEFAREAEARGFHSLYVPEHTHIPSSRATPAPMGEPLPDYYSRMLDPFVALMQAAAATKTIRVGTAVCLVMERDPIVTAKEVATIDFLTGGRFTLGIGFGWNREEMAHHGVVYEERREITREKILAMKALWTQDEASFDGTHVRLEPTWAWPKPVQRPHPPVLIGGGAGPKMFAAVAEYADGWMPIGGRGIAKNLPALEEGLAKHGRALKDCEIVPVGTIPDPGKLDYLAGLGVREIVLGVEPGTRDEVLPILDRYTDVVGPMRSG